MKLQKLVERLQGIIADDPNLCEATVWLEGCDCWGECKAADIERDKHGGVVVLICREEKPNMRAQW